MNTLGFQSKVVGKMLPYDIQDSNERVYARKHINGYIDKAIADDPEANAMVFKAVEIINVWLAHWMAPFNGQCATENYWEIKTTRLKAVQELDIELLVRNVFSVVASQTEPTLLVSVAGLCATKLGWNDKRESLVTISELLAVMRISKAYSIMKDGEEGSLKVENHIDLPNELKIAIEL